MERFCVVSNGDSPCVVSNGDSQFSKKELGRYCVLTINQRLGNSVQVLAWLLLGKILPRGVCHPTWHEDYKRGIRDKRPVAEYDWHEDYKRGIRDKRPVAEYDWHEDYKRGIRDKRPVAEYDWHEDYKRGIRDKCLVAEYDWHEDYKRGIRDKRPVAEYDWHEARSFHFTVPKPPGSLTSPGAIKNGQDMFAQIGRHMLEKSGRLDLLN
ncbi:hypothetical protein Btru_063013 [Bulinus truncatus]|nr:hypothetical protein Btru_063013 [Bulinus truncatus]